MKFVSGVIKKVLSFFLVICNWRNYVIKKVLSYFLVICNWRRDIPTLPRVPPPSFSRSATEHYMYIIEHGAYY